MSMEPDDPRTDEGLDEAEPRPPVAHVRITYTGPIAPHWDIEGLEGEEALVDEFRQRAVARLQLLPPHDPQFRRNRERVNRDAERENILLEWDLGYDEDEMEGAASLGDKPRAGAEETEEA